MAKLSWIVEREKRHAEHAAAQAVAEGLHQVLPAQDVYVYLWHQGGDEEAKKLTRWLWRSKDRSADTFPAAILDVVRQGGLMLVSVSDDQHSPLYAWMYQPGHGVWAMSADQAQVRIQLSPDYLDAFEIPGVPSWEPQ